MADRGHVGLLQDRYGDLSSGRVFKLGCWLVAVGLAVAQAVTGADQTMNVAAFLGAALGAEITQKATGL